MIGMILRRSTHGIVWLFLVCGAMAVASSAANAAPVNDLLIIDHRSTRLTDVPSEWIAAAKNHLHIAYGHTSHGSQITTGMTGLTSFANAPNGGASYAWNDGGLGGALDLDDMPFLGAYDLGNPNFTAWATATRKYLNKQANSDVNVVMWSWCSELSSATKSDVATYLSLMSRLEREYPRVCFVYMTGHTDGTGLDGNLHKRNEQIREYCRVNHRVVYDFEDIESYDPDGVYFGDKYVTDSCAYDGGNWATEWQSAHTKGIYWYDCVSAHSQPLNANLKAYAAWWLWARLAGWGRLAGPTVSGCSPSAGRAGTVVTLTGTGLTGVKAVTFGGTPAIKFTVVSDAQLRATIPRRASSGKIRVFKGTSSGTSTTSYEIKPNVASVTPVSIRRGGRIVIAGSGFGTRRSLSVVRFGNRRCTRYLSWNKTRISCRVPASCRLGRVSVRVTTVTGSSNSRTVFVRR